MSTTTEVIGKTTEKDGDKTYHVLKFKVCNKGDQPVDIKLADNPWRKPEKGDHKVFGPKLYEVLKKDGSGVDDDKSREKALEHWENPDSKNGDPVTLGKAGSATACKEFKVRYPFEPVCTYIDVYEKQADGTYTWPGQNVTELWSDLKTVSMFPAGPKAQVVCVLPFWFPMSLEAEWSGDIELALERLDGAPPEFEVVHTFPELGVPQPLTFGDRHSECAVVLRQVAPTTERHYVEAIFRVHKPEHLAHRTRHVGFWLSGSGPADGRDAAG